MMLATILGYTLKDIIYTFSDIHIYESQYEKVKELLSREPKKMPTVTLDSSVQDIFDFRPEHFTLSDYEPGHYIATLKMPAYLLNVGDYFFDVLIGEPLVVGYDEKKNIPLEIINTNNPRSALLRGVSIGKIAPILDFKVTTNKQ